MQFETLSIQEYYPIIRQISLDAFKTEALLFSYPYNGLDRIDMGFRKMVWGTYTTAFPSFSEKSNGVSYQILIVDSSLGFTNIVIFLREGNHPDFLCFGPFRTEEISVPIINRIMKENHIPSKHFSYIENFYMGLPVIDMEDFLTTMRHLISNFVPGVADCPIHHMDYSSEKHEFNPSDSRIEQFNADYAEECAMRVSEMLSTISAGNTTQAPEKMKSLIDFVGTLTTGSVVQIKKELHGINNLIVSRLLESSIHPSYVFQLAQTFDIMIVQTSSKSQLRHLPFEMARKYSMLAKNYAYDEYSHLIRSVVNHINQHIDGDLSLSHLAETFDKNPSYLSNAFKKEVGETLTNYINNQRIQAAVRLFNTTPLSVSEVAGNVGISDFGYFSKLFKKYVGTSPREYKKMLGK